MSPALGAQSLNHRTVSASVSMGIDARRQSEGVRGVVGKGGGCSRWDPEQGTAVGNQGSVLRGTCDRPCREHLGIVPIRDTEVGVFLEKLWGPFEASVIITIISCKLPHLSREGRKENVSSMTPGFLDFTLFSALVCLVQQTAFRYTGNKAVCLVVQSCLIFVTL